MRSAGGLVPSYVESGGRLGASRKRPGRPDAAGRVKKWTRSRFKLAEEEVILVRETASSIPGYPPRETEVVFWTTDGRRHPFRLFKRVEDIVESDLPPVWLKEALSACDGFGCECC